MTEERITETIKARILYKTTKAVSVLIDFKQYYIPDSIIHNLDEIQLSDHELVQEFVVERWWVEKNGINGWE